MKKINNYFIGITMALSILSCHKKRDNDPKPSVNNSVAQPIVTYYQDIKLYNQFANVGVKHYFSMKDSIFSDDKFFDFDICYYNLSLGSPSANYYLLGSPADKIYTDKAYSGLTSTRSTAFYKVPSSFTYANFDSLKVSSELKTFIDNKCILIFSNADLQLAQAMRSEDSYGWAPNSIFGFKTSSGKYGLIKILSSPTGSASGTDPLKNTPGVIRLDIKIEK
jgi:hypothetical protein